MRFIKFLTILFAASFVYFLGNSQSAYAISQCEAQGGWCVMTYVCQHYHRQEGATCRTYDVSPWSSVSEGCGYGKTCIDDTGTPPTCNTSARCVPNAWVGPYNCAGTGYRYTCYYTKYSGNPNIFCVDPGGQFINSRHQVIPGKGYFCR